MYFPPIQCPYLYIWPLTISCFSSLTFVTPPRGYMYFQFPFHSVPGLLAFVFFFPFFSFPFRYDAGSFRIWCQVFQSPSRRCPLVIACPLAVLYNGEVIQRVPLSGSWLCYLLRIGTWVSMLSVVWAVVIFFFCACFPYTSLRLWIRKVFFPILFDMCTTCPFLRFLLGCFRRGMQFPFHDGFAVLISFEEIEEEVIFGGSSPYLYNFCILDRGDPRCVCFRVVQLFGNYLIVCYFPFGGRFSLFPLRLSPQRVSIPFHHFATLSYPCVGFSIFYTIIPFAGFHTPTCGTPTRSFRSVFLYFVLVSQDSTIPLAEAVPPLRKRRFCLNFLLLPCFGSFRFR